MFKEDNSQAKNLDISSDNIGLPHKNRNAASSLQHQNRYFKRQNDNLRKQLQTISSRLDEQIRKRTDNKKRRPWSKDPDEVSFMQLQNAYKKCDIYKKQVNYYRKKLSCIEDEGKYEQYDVKMSAYMKQNIELRGQIKELKKVIKMQEKGLSEMGTQEYTKLVKDNQRLKQQNRRLKKNLSQYRLASLNIKQSHEKTQQNTTSNKQLTSSTQEKQDESLRQKLQKSYMKIKMQNKQHTQMRDIIQNYRSQLQEKDKQLMTLRQRIANLRKNNEQLLAEVNTKRSTQVHSSNKKTIHMKQQKNDNLPKSRAERVKTEPGQVFMTEAKQQKVDNKEGKQDKKGQKVEYGPGNSNSTKWSHEVYNSKIKQIEIITDQNGNIKDLHAKYMKGQPKRYELAPKQKSTILSCSEGEYVKTMTGIFNKGCLTFLTLITNNKRGQDFGLKQGQNDKNVGEAFSCKLDETECIGALFGQKNSEGITKIGCHILKV